MAVESQPSKTIPTSISEKDTEDMVIRFEEKRGWKPQRATGKVGYGIVSRGPRGKIRYIVAKSQLSDISYPMDILRLGKRLANFYLYVVNLQSDTKGRKTLYVVPPSVVFPNSEPLVQMLFRVRNLRHKSVERHPVE